MPSFPTTALASLLALSLSTMQLAAQDKKPRLEGLEEGYRAIETFTNVLEIIRESYVDEEKVGYDKLMAAALDGMLRSLDPHSSFIHPELYKKVRQKSDGRADSIGLSIERQDGAFVVISVREDGPGARSGILRGDIVVKLNDQEAKAMSPDSLNALLLGKPGQTLKLQVRRPSTQQTLDFELLHAVLRRDTVRGALMLNASMTKGKKIGYARLLQFNAPSAGELANALDKLEDAGMEAFVLDLRNNPGGLVTSAVAILSEFLPEDTVVMSTEGRDPGQDPPPLKTASRKRRKREYPMAVLVNGSSASASEVVSGALQDLKRAVIIGETTFGKGSVQSIIGVGSGAAVRLTIAKYYTPSKKMIHGNGVTPDIVEKLTPEEEKKIFEWRSQNPESATDPTALAKIGDRQLERAIKELIKKPSAQSESDHP